MARMNALARAGISLVAAASLALVGCARGDRPLVRPLEAPPAYAAPISAASVGAQARSLPTTRPATRTRAESPGLVAAEALLVRTLAGYGYSPTLEPIPWPSSEQSAGWSNVIAEIRGATLPDEVLLVTAHYDAVPESPGADDNASGVAGVLEVARRLSDPAFAERTRRTVRFVLFNIEEWGLHGADHHAQLAAERSNERIVGVINLEMIGSFTDEPGSPRSPIPRIPGVVGPPTVGDASVIAANRPSSPVARRPGALPRQGDPDLRTFLLDFIPGDGRVFPDTRRSDHAPFWELGVPAVMVTDTSEFRNPHYHKATDTVETLDLGRMARVVRGVEHAVRVLSGSTDDGATP